MSGAGGRNCCLRSWRWLHLKRKCSTVSLSLQRGHVGDGTWLILCRCWFRGACCVRKRKIMLWSLRDRSFMPSLGLGVGMCWKTDLPVEPVAQPFSHSSLEICLTMFIAVLRGTLLSFCSFLDPFLASVSALLFPGIPE